MAGQALTIALLAFLAAAQPVDAQPPKAAGAPPGNGTTRYCMRVGPITGNLAETIACWTRAEWAEQGVDVDREWAKQGVRIIA